MTRPNIATPPDEPEPPTSMTSPTTRDIASAEPPKSPLKDVDYAPRATQHKRRLQQRNVAAARGRFSGGAATRRCRAARADVVSRQQSSVPRARCGPLLSRDRVRRHSSSTADQRRGGRGPRSCLGTRRPPRAGRHRSARPGARRPSVSPGARAPASGCMTITNLAANSAAGRRAPATATAWARTRRSASTGSSCVSRPFRNSRSPQLGAGVLDGAAARALAGRRSRG